MESLSGQAVESSDDIWEDLCESHFDNGTGYVAMLRAYVDASTRDSGLISVAVYLFESLRVRRFRQQWRDAFGTTKSFSWADLISRNKQFRSLRGQDAEHSRLVAEGVSIVRVNVIAGSIVSVWKQDIENFSPTWIAGFGHAYAIAGHIALVAMGRWAKENNHRSGIAYVIEAGDEGYDQLEHLLSYATKAPSVADAYQWRGHSTIPKTPNAAFHAPDLLAWEWGKFILETAIEQKRPMRLSLINLVAGRLDSYRFHHLHGHSLVEFLNRVRDLGFEQMQEDFDALSSVPSMDVSESVQSSEQKELSANHE